MKIKHFFLVGAVTMGLVAIYWILGQWLFLDLSSEELKLYSIRREIALIEAVVLYIAYKVS